MPYSGGYGHRNNRSLDDMIQLFYSIYYKSIFGGIRRLEAAQISVGRDKECAIWLPDKIVSRDHAILLCAGNHYCLRDVGSRNGTKVNGAKISIERVLKNGDEVEIGPYLLKIWYSLADAIRQSVSTEESTNPQTIQAEGHVTNGEKRVPPLTPAQRRVFDLLLEGLIEKEVAAKLGITINTVHGHAKAIYKALSVSTRGELISRWVDCLDR